MEMEKGKGGGYLHISLEFRLLLLHALCVYALGCQLSYIFLKVSWVLVLPNLIDLTSVFM